MVVAWVVVALGMAVVEIATVAFYAAFLAVGAFAAAVSALFGANVFVQAVVFLAISLVGILALRPLMVSRRHPRVASGAQGMLGMTVVVTDPIEGEHDRGHVSVAGETWPAVSADGEPIKAESSVTVVEIRGATLGVRR
jgi:membrane protein implicated in regulation of membrane protease activity